LEVESLLSFPWHLMRVVHTSKDEGPRRNEGLH
jgi:hypothetical protein